MNIILRETAGMDWSLHAVREASQEWWCSGESSTLLDSFSMSDRQLNSRALTAHQAKI